MINADFELLGIIADMLNLNKNNSVHFSAANILVTSASEKVLMIKAVQDAARRLDLNSQVIAGDSNKDALTKYVADDFWHMPPTDNIHLKDILSGCKERAIQFIIPTRDGELVFWSENMDYFTEENIQVIISPVETVKICLDKYAFSQFGEEKELPFIPARINLDEINFGSYVVKERYGSGSHMIACNMGREKVLDHSKQMEKPLFQPYIEGNEISIDAWFDQSHQIKGIILRRRDTVVNGESKVTTTFQDTDIEKVALKVLQAMKFCGPVMLQALIDKKNDIHIIECNVRFGGASTASIEAGLDVFYWSLLECTGADLNNYPFQRISNEVRQLRISNDIYFYGTNF